MSSTATKADFLLLNDFKPFADAQAQLDELRRQLEKVPDFQQVELVPRGQSTVVASIPARNERQREHLKALLNQKVEGWHVIEEQDYGLPRVF